MALSLSVVGTQDPVYGEIEYNKNEITTTTLSPGNYTLRIYQPFGGNALNCINFRLRVTPPPPPSSAANALLQFAAEVQFTDVDPLLESCPDMYLPSNWNNPAFLHPLTGQSVDFDRDVLAKVIGTGVFARN